MSETDDPTGTLAQESVPPTTKPAFSPSDEPATVQLQASAHRRETPTGARWHLTRRFRPMTWRRRRWNRIRNTSAPCRSRQSSGACVVRRPAGCSGSAKAKAVATIAGPAEVHSARALNGAATPPIRFGAWTLNRPCCRTGRRFDPPNRSPDWALHTGAGTPLRAPLFRHLFVGQHLLVIPVQVELA